MSTTVWESINLRAPLERVWALVRPVNFAYLPNVIAPAAAATESKEAKETKADTTAAEVGAHRTVTYKDGTLQTIRITAISDVEYSVSWELEVSVPATAFQAQTHTVRLRRVTESNTTFLEWNTQFSSDASTEVLSDAKFKQADNFAALAVALGVPSSQPRLELTYFPARGRAEVSRLLLAQAGLVYEDTRLTPTQWGAKKASSPFGQLPLLTVDGKTFGQSNAIERYIARLGGLAGANSSEWLLIDGYTQTVKDAAPAFISAVSPYENKTEEEKIPKIAAYFAGDFRKYAPYFNKTASESKSGWLVGSKISYADISVYYLYSMVKQVNAGAFAEFPALDALVSRVAATPRIAAWLKARPVSPF